MTRISNVAFLTGPSDKDRCALSPEQLSFLLQLGGPTRKLVMTNFPYQQTLPFRRVPLLRAAWNNIISYFRSRRSEFSSTYSAAIIGLIEQAEHTFFLTGSCGLELYNNLSLPQSLEARCTLICYGPVSRRRPSYARTVMVQSSCDLISRALFRWPHQQLRCSHMNYLGDPEFLRICQTELLFNAPHPCFSTSE